MENSRAKKSKMRIIQVHNRYRRISGEDIFFDSTVNVLRQRGHDVVLFERNSTGFDAGILSRVKAFGAGLYSPSAILDMRRLIDREHPDVVHIHNVYPLISPFVLELCEQAGLPVVMTCHNYRLICPAGIQFSGTHFCDKCKYGREYWCLIKNCKHNLLQSASYALRGAVATRKRLFLKNVTIFVAVSNFVAVRLSEGAIPRDRIRVVPNMISNHELPPASKGGEYIAYAGGITREKGIDTLISAARICGLPVRAAGQRLPGDELMEMLPANFEYVGFLSNSEVLTLFSGARFVVIPSIWAEPFGLVAVEAMSLGLPVLAAASGGLQEIVGDGVTGLLFRPGDAADLADKMERLWKNPSVCADMGRQGREKALREYTEDAYYRRLIGVYEEAIQWKRQEVC